MKLFTVLFIALTGLLKINSLFTNDDHFIMLLNTKYMLQDTIKKPTVLLNETVVQPMTVLVIHDTAATVEDISRILPKSYGELFTFINQNGLTPGKVMGFYYSYQPPFVMDAGVEVNKAPAALSGRITVKNIAGGKAVIARYTGPYEKVDIAYTAITNWLKEHKKEAKEAPFEAYLNDPASVKDPSELRTDVYQLIK